MKRTRNEMTYIKEIPFGHSLELKCLWDGTKQNEFVETAGKDCQRAVLRNLDITLMAVERIGGTSVA